MWGELLVWMIGSLGLGQGKAPWPEPAKQLALRPARTETIELELPDLGQERHPPGVLRTLEPEKIRHLVFHIPRPTIHSAFPKINTIGTGLVQVMKARRDEVVYEVDLLRHEGRYYELGPEDNIVEIKVIPRPGAQPLLARWVIVPPQDPAAWRSVSTSAPVQAGSNVSRMILLEELEGGSRVELGRGITAARRVVLRAEVSGSDPAVSLRVTWLGANGQPLTRVVGEPTTQEASRSAARTPSAAAFETTIELPVGKNRIAAEVFHGYDVLLRSQFDLMRRAPTAPLSIAGDKWAVVIGVSDYRAQGLDLKFAHRDAEALGDLLVAQAGFAAERVRLLTNERATHDEIRKALFSFLATTKPEDLVLVFLAGHGVPDPANNDNFYFLLHDSDMANLGGTALPMWDLDGLMDFTIRSRNIVLIADACHSGAIAGYSSSSASGFNFFNKYLETLAREKGRLVITASQAHESSFETSETGHGVFTEELLHGLRGEADDNPKDGVVTAGELLDFLRLRVPEVTGGGQHPSATHEGFDLGLPLASIPR